jgi:transposase
MGKFATTSHELITADATFIGIDYHKRFSMICFGDANGNVLAFHKLYHEREAVKQFFMNLKHTRCAIESCRGYEWLIDLVQDLGIKITVCNPKKIKLIVETRCKTDKIDSKTLMVLLAKDFLPSSYIPTIEERKLRELLRWRALLVRNVTRIKCAISCLVDKENLALNQKDLFTKRGLAFLQNAPLSDTHRILLNKQLDVLLELENRVRDEDKWAKAESNRLPGATNLQTIPGFGPLISLIYIAEVGNVARFRSACQVSAYAGLVSSVYQSADTRRQGSISKEGPSYLRAALVQAAWVAIQKNTYFRQKFNSIAFRRGRNKAITAIARKLCEIAFRLIRDNAVFDENKLTA